MRIEGPGKQRIDTALVTGAAGFIGAALVRALAEGGAEGGAEVHALVHPRSSVHRLGVLPPGVRVHRVDVADPVLLAPLVRRLGPFHAFHAAAHHGHPLGEADERAAWRDTVEATRTLLQALDGVPLLRLVHLGSSLEYGRSDRPLRESDPEAPTTRRGEMKLAATRAVRRWSDEGRRPATVLRPFSVYGPGETPERLVPTLLRCLAESTPFPTTAGTFRRDLVHVDDVVDACLRSALCPGAEGRTLNVGTGVEWSTEDVVRVAEAVTGRSVKVVRGAFPPRPPDTEHWVADPALTRSVLGWSPPTSLPEGLARTFAALQTLAP